MTPNDTSEVVKMKRYSSITPYVSPKYMRIDKRISLNEENIWYLNGIIKAKNREKLFPFSFKPTFKVPTTYLNVVKCIPTLCWYFNHYKYNTK